MKLTEIDTRELERELYTCAQCGYCQDACTIYGEIPWESATPRGKLGWIKKILTKGILRENIEADENFTKRLFQCTLCGKCAEVCAFNAIAIIKQTVLVFPELCHGCGACSYMCPEKAICEVSVTL